MRPLRVVALGLVAAVPAAPAGAWPAELQIALLRDACRIVPKTLSRLIYEREKEVVEEAQRFPVKLGHVLAVDMNGGRLQPETLAALDAHAGEAIALLRQRRISEGIVRLGAMLRVPADLADPALASGSEGYPPGLTREYYSFIEANLSKLPVTLDDADALKLPRGRLPAYWQGLLERSREQTDILRAGMFQRGQVVDHRALDFRSPVFAVAQISYSRAVTAIAATWIAMWSEARGDLTRQPQPRIVTPEEAAPLNP
ncbi:MAG TPA: hypothetical protein VKA01_00480 [Vicinamibacteria bacterium]|nr:hypothetical protein [Vicinamibacteria bacterium]